MTMTMTMKMMTKNNNNESGSLGKDHILLAPLLVPGSMYDMQYVYYV